MTKRYLVRKRKRRSDAGKPRGVPSKPKSMFRDDPSSTDWITVRQAAEILGVSTERVYQMVRSGKAFVCSVTYRGRVLISKRWLEAEMYYRAIMARVKDHRKGGEAA